MAKQKDCVLALDVGSTCIKAIVVNSELDILGRSSSKTPYIQPKPWMLEIDPEVIWELVKNVIFASVKDAGLEFKDISGIGVSSQRGCCLTWDKDTGKPFHNILSWMDKRSAPFAEEWNNSFTLKAAKLGSSLLYYLSGFNRKFSIGRALHFQSFHGSMMLYTLMTTNTELREKAREGKALFGGLDCWLLWKLTSGKAHITDHSLASSTAMYDPMQCDWSSLISILGIPRTMLPTVVDTCGDLATVDEEVFGVPLKVTSVVADASASAFGLCCFEPGHITCSLGTGAFLDVTTGSHVHTSLSGIYPLVAWKLGKDTMYFAESHGGALAPAVDWMKTLGFVEKLEELDALAMSVPDSGGVFFVPAYSGLEQPTKDPTACTSLFGVQRQTKKEHIIRAVLEAVAFRFYQLYQQMKKETRVPLLNVIRVSGGMSNSDVILQSIASLFNCKVERPNETDRVGIGTAFLAGLGAGIWNSQADIAQTWKVARTFTADAEEHIRLRISFDMWFKATGRCRHWYDQDEVR